MGAIHFVGVAGTGMSALAQIQALSGARVTGSDRLADREALGETRRRLEAAMNGEGRHLLLPGGGPVSRALVAEGARLGLIR